MFIIWITVLFILSSTDVFRQKISARELISNAHLQHLKTKVSAVAFQRLAAWRSLIDENKNKSERLQLHIVNKFFNRLHFENDEEQFIGQIDYWQTPIEFLTNGAGDCEDYAIAKYFTLLALGVKDKKLRITYVKLKKENQAHMVLAYYPTVSSVPLVLDNRRPDIKKANMLTNLSPIYSFNGKGLWWSKLRGEDKRLGKSNRLNKWRELIIRMKLEE